MLNLSSYLVMVILVLDHTIGSPLNGPCASNEECGTFDTHCVNGTCLCRDNFITVYDSCVHVASESIECTRKEQCHSLLGNKSTCKNRRCVCRPFHHLHKKQCVKNKDLHDICEHDHQCYCGQDCVERIGCMNHKCTCREGYKTYSTRRCIVDPLFPVETPPIAVMQSPVAVQSSAALKNVSILLYILLFLYL